MRRAVSIFSNVVFLGLLSLFAIPFSATAYGQSGGAQTAAIHNWHAMGSSPCVWWKPKADARGGLDISASVQSLKSNGIQCSVFVIEKSSPVNSFSNFKKLLAATKDTNIAMWAVIVPPSEGGANTLPYRTNYVAWAQAFAKLSLQYKNFRGFNIDDYLNAPNHKILTKAYGCKIYAAKERINPNLLFVPTIYELDRNVANRLSGCVDGVWLWFEDLESAGGLQTILEDSRYAVHGRFPIYGGVYGHWTSWHKEGNPTPSVFERTLSTACKYSDGVVIWQLQLNPGNPLLAVTKKFLPGGSSPYAGKCGVR